MSQALKENALDLAEIVKNLVTEDDEPVDNLDAEKEQRLLTEPLYTSWTPPPDPAKPNEPRRFIAAANVGIFPSVHEPPLVPDMFLSIDVIPPKNWREQTKRSYFFWEFGKPPEVVVEIVSNREGDELTRKLVRYAQIDVTYYVVFDLLRLLSEDEVRVYERGFGRRYRLRGDHDLPDVGLKLTLWRGVFEDQEDTWLRWCNEKGELIPTGQERAVSAEERLRSAEQRAATAEERATRLAAKLRELGLDPEPL
jgi:Uma2 family endonuclease